MSRSTPVGNFEACADGMVLRTLVSLFQVDVGALDTLPDGY